MKYKIQHEAVISRQKKVIVKRDCEIVSLKRKMEKMASTATYMVEKIAEQKAELEKMRDEALLLRQKTWAEFQSYIHPNTVLVDGKKLSVCHKFNITRAELEKAVRYAESSSLDCVTVSVSGGNVGSSIYVSAGWETAAMDISDY